MKKEQPDRENFFDIFITKTFNGYLRNTGFNFDLETRTISAYNFGYHIKDYEFEELKNVSGNREQSKAIGKFVGNVIKLAEEQQRKRDLSQGIESEKRILESGKRENEELLRSINRAKFRSGSILEQTNTAERNRTKILRQIQDCNGELFKTNNPRFIADNAYLLRQANKAYTENLKDNQQIKQNLLDKKV